MTIKHTSFSLFIQLVLAAIVLHAVLVLHGFEGRVHAVDIKDETTCSILTRRPPTLINEKQTPFGVTFTKERLKYVDGYPDGTFRPDDGVSRAEVAAMLLRLVDESGKGEQTAAAAPSDASYGEWYERVVSCALASGLTLGYPNGEFRPKELIKRSEFFAMLSRFVLDGCSEDFEPTSFPDVPRSYWAYFHISVCATYGWIMGYEGGAFRPEGYLTRAEAVAVLNRALGRDVASESSAKSMSPYSDLEESHWAFEQIMEASAPDLETTQARNGGVADADSGGATAANPGGASSANSQNSFIDATEGIFMRGEMIVEMKEKTKTSEFRALFPELGIERIIDLYEKAKRDIRSMGGSQPNLSEKTIFRVWLKDQSDECLFAAIDIVSRHPSVEYAVPYGYFYLPNYIAIVFAETNQRTPFVPGLVSVSMKSETYPSLFLKRFSNIAIEEITCGSSYELSRSRYFGVVLTSKTYESVYEAIEVFLAHPSVETAEPLVPYGIY